ncbi:hypothetical protein [Blastococcus sp. TF02A-26]|uniref:hypothetical protein n=1 Tax=Blastococcus sp. TF02A-26 TaxID=2250577 RepID=UPI000DE8D4F3|nr:hypothetical protein [Blastococcus sp. TF02A-26]RBY88682.1 hypothetical protein DQ240_04680 [Blastococcus sp. TF02A-26]
MNEITLLRQAGPEGPDLTPDVRSAARAALLDEIAASRPRRRLPVPRRRTAFRIGAAVVGVAAAWTTAALVAGPDGGAPGGRVGEPSPPAVDPGVALVDFAMPAAPLALPTAPPGTTGPALGASGNGDTSSSYAGIADPQEGVFITVGTTPPPPIAVPEGADPLEEQTLTIGGRQARMVVMNPEYDDARTVYVDWERSPGQWVSLMGTGRFADGRELAALAEQLVEDARAVPVQVDLAPAGYTLDFVKAGGRIVRLADDSDPAMSRGLTVSVPLPAEVLPIEQAPVVVAHGAGPAEQVTVQGQGAELVRLDSGRGYTGWYLQARFPDGTAFTVEVDGDLTSQQVVQIADRVTHTP